MRIVVGVATELLAKIVAHAVSQKIKSFKNNWLETEALVAKLGLRYIFFPYDTPACRLQHRIFAKILCSIIPKATVRISWGVGSAASPSSSKENSKTGFRSFSHVIDYLEELAGRDRVYATGVIDQYVRELSPSSFFRHFRIDSDFIERVYRARKIASRLAEQYDTVFLTDSAYLENRALISAFLDRGREIRIVNPDGVWARVTRSEDELFDKSLFEQASLDSDERELASIERYLQKRFSGQARSDLDSSKAFKHSPFAAKDQLPRVKVLALHSFRDAALAPLGLQNQKSLFRTYFEWADFVLREIAKSPEGWAIRQHPSSSSYPGDDEIYSRLIREYSLEECTSLNGISMSQILAAKLPIFTFQGTIALEAAIFGYKAVTCSTLYSEFSNVVLEKDALATLVSQEFDALREPIPEEVSGRARKLLYLRHNPQLKPFAPSISQLPRDVGVRSSLASATQALSLASRAMSSQGARSVFNALGDLGNEEAPLRPVS